MNRISRLNDSYGRFFKNSARFALLPYGLAYVSGQLITPGHMPDNEAWEAEVAQNRYIMCITLTVIPVLPALTAITLGLALIGAAIAALSMLLTYPISAVADLLATKSLDRNKYAY